MERIDLSTIDQSILKHENNYIADIDKIDIRLIYDKLLSKEKLVGVECRFLYWLNHNYGFDLKLPKPIIPKLLYVNCSFEKFSSDFLTSSYRKNIFNSLTQLSNLIKMKCNIKLVEIIIGGSFIDINKEFPNDIDVALLYPEEHKNNSIFTLSKTEVRNLVNPHLDVIFLPRDFTMNSFKSFSRIMCLCNDLNYKTEDDEVFPAEKIIFSQQSLVKIEL